ncbi:AraC family transcriptional regulator [Paenibacillus cymbidii]|uniref:AraC family transcriptional regulator n=1 Tax=Paenibacillus cymbidii TaxID=1639034 RepID=UPI0010814758|nr:helix-turn-helix domain-containing protein [Paenibacillus cymbidii]
MKWLSNYFSRKFFWRILSTNSLLVVVFLLVFCSIVYVYSRDKTLDLQQDANRKVLNQVNYNIDNLNEMVKSLAVSAIYNRDLTSLMNTVDLEVFEFYNKLRKLEDIQNANLYIRSIQIYNAYNKCTYASDNAPVSCSQDNKSELQQYVEAHPVLPKLKLLPYVTNMDGAPQRVFAYFMYGSVDNYSPGESVLMVLIKPEWLFDNIRTLNELADDALGSVYLVDSDGQLIEQGNESDLTDASRQEMLDKLKDATDQSGYFIVKNGAGKQIVTYLTSSLNQWKVVSVQPYDQLFGKINQIGTFSLFALAAIAILSVLVSVLFSVRVYKPVGGLVNQLKTLPNRGPEAAGGDRDEMIFLTNVYKDMQSNIVQMQESGMANRQVLYQYFLREWMADSAAITEEQIEQYTGGNKWIPVSPFRIALLKIDDYAAFCSERSEAERKLFRFAIGNIAEEIAGERFAGQTLDMPGDHVLLLIGLPEDGAGRQERQQDQVEAVLRRIQETLLGYYKLSITVVCSDPMTDYRQATASYQLAQTHALYRMIAGKGTIITPAVYNNQQKEPDRQVPPELYRKLAESIMSNQPEQMKQRLDSVFAVIATYHCEHVDEAILQLLMFVNQTIREMKTPKAGSMAVVLQRYRRQALEQETLAAVRELFDRMLLELTNERETGKPEKPEFLIGAVKDMVETNFTDPNLSLQSIADALNMSSGYLGRYFRSKESVSVADYINEIRLTQSLKLLEQGDDSIAAIIQKVGFTNESNYFKLFKKRFGITPNEYRLTRSTG